jgi:hypothetical protein
MAGMKNHTIYALYLVAQTAGGIMGLMYLALHITRHFGANELDSVAYAIGVAIAYALVTLTVTFGPAIDGLSPKIDRIIESIDHHS